MVAELARTPPHETTEGRRRLAAKGQTAYGTSYPVPNVAYLKKALQAVGRVKAGKRGVLARFLRKRARQLGATNVIKGSWADNRQGATAMANAYMRAIQLAAMPDVSSTSGPRVTQNAASGADALIAKIKAKLMAKNMPEARAEMFARNAVKRLKARTVSMANPAEEDDTEPDVMTRSYLYDAQKTLSHLKRDHGLEVGEITSPIAEHQSRHRGGVDKLIKYHRAVEGHLGHEYRGKTAAPRTRQTKLDEPSPGED